MRGYQKKVIYMKNTGSALFEEAYFILRPDCEKENEHRKTDMVSEANKIIRENFGLKKDGFFASHREAFISFIIGAFLSFIISLIVFL